MPIPEQGTQLILTSVQLSVYVITVAFAVSKVIIALYKRSIFFSLFFSMLLLSCGIELGMQSYQLSSLLQGNQPNIAIIATINIYSITVESVIILMLAYYWRETEAVLRNNMDTAIQQQQFPVFLVALYSIWLLLYTCFVVYLCIDQYSSPMQDVLYLLCQTITVGLIVWSLVAQMVSGSKLSKTLAVYEQRISLVSINKTKFRLLYWLTSSLNALKIIFLAIVTIMLRIKNQYTDYQWLAAQVYTFSTVVVLWIYLSAFNVRLKKQMKQSQLTDEMVDKTDSKASRDSRRETELSDTITEKTV